MSEKIICYNLFTMSDSVIINSNIAKDLVTSIRELKEEVSALKKILVMTKYGSDKWWHDEIVRGENDIKKSDYKIYKNAKSLISDLHKGI